MNKKTTATTTKTTVKPKCWGQEVKWTVAFHGAQCSPEQQQWAPPVLTSTLFLSSFCAGRRAGRENVPGFYKATLQQSRLLAYLLEYHSRKYQEWYKAITNSVYRHSCNAIKSRLLRDKKTYCFSFPFMHAWHCTVGWAELLVLAEIRVPLQLPGPAAEKQVLISVSHCGLLWSHKTSGKSP